MQYNVYHKNINKTTNGSVVLLFPIAFIDLLYIFILFSEQLLLENIIIPYKTRQRNTQSYII